MCQRRSLARWGRLCCVRPVEAVHILCAGCVSLGRFSQRVGTCTEGVVSHVWCRRARIGVALTRHARPPSEQPHTDDDGVGAGKEAENVLTVGFKRRCYWSEVYLLLKSEGGEGLFNP